MKLDFSKSVGDPMVEIGRLGLIEFCGKDKFESFEEMEEEIKKLFNVYSSFAPKSKQFLRYAS